MSVGTPDLLLDETEVGAVDLVSDEIEARSPWQLFFKRFREDRFALAGLVFLTNDGELAAQLLKHWDKIEQIYHIKIKGMLRREDLGRLGKEIGARLETLRQPDASRGRAANYWYEVRMRSSKKEDLRSVLFREQHPVEKIKRIGLANLTLEGVPRGRYRLLRPDEVSTLRKSAASPPQHKPR